MTRRSLADDLLAFDRPPIDRVLRMSLKADPTVDNVVGAYRDLVKVSETELRVALEELLRHQPVPAEQLLAVLSALNDVELRLEKLRQHLWFLASDESIPH